MKSHYTMFSIFACILVYLITSTNSKSMVKNLPGFPGDLPFTLETGYVGVGDNDEIQLFYYFVQSQRDPLHDPLLLYLSGGPGTPALYAFMYQLGPLTISLESSSRDNITLELNHNSWTKWLVEHPRFLRNPLYITGISYMGILIPFITLKAFNGNEQGNQPQLNIKGCLIVSPLTDKFKDFNSRLEYAHRLALISDDIYRATKETCHGNYVISDPKNTLCSTNLQRVDECTSGINLSNILEPLCDDSNPDPACDVREVYFVSWVNNEDVPKVLHIREGTSWEQNGDIHYDFMKNDTIYYSYDIFESVVYHEQLIIRNCQVLIISGDHDMTFPYVGVIEWIRSLNLFIESPWNPWFVNNQVAGYRMTFAKDGYTLNYATVKGAGHGPAIDRPTETSVIVDEWLASHVHLSDDSYIA